MLAPLLSALLCAAPPPLTEAVRREGERLLPRLLETYRWFHANPELSGQEVKTAARLAKEVRALGLSVSAPIGGTGFVAVLEGKKGPGPVVLWRADMDALPISENTGLPYASKNRGVMHACGHDLHMSNALGALQILKALEREWGGTVLFVAQPAEEIGGGARAMLDDPAFAKLLARVGKPIVALALHDSSKDPAGHVALDPGYYSANVDSIDITVHGVGGHGAHPHRTVDPILIGAQIVVSLQSIVSRRVKPGVPAVITVGKFSGGSKHNIIPPRVELQLTVRSYGDETRTLLLGEIERLARETARAYGAPRDPEIRAAEAFTPSGYNDPAWSVRLRRMFVEVLGEARVRSPEPPGTGGEDFAEFPRRLGIPGAMFSLGASPAALVAEKGPDGVPSLHAPEFAPDAEGALRTGVVVTALALLEALAGEAAAR